MYPSVSGIFMQNDYYPASSEVSMQVYVVLNSLFLDLTIQQAFPCKSRLGDAENAPLVEYEVRSN